MIVVPAGVRVHLALGHTDMRKARSADCSGKKNHLFAGNDGGGHRWAVLCSLVETYKLNDVEPHAYHGYPINRFDELLPWAWKQQIRAGSANLNRSISGVSA